MSDLKSIVRHGIKRVAPLLWHMYLKKRRKLGSFGATITISFDLDYPEDYDRLPYLLDILESYNLKGSFAVIGKFIEMYPALHNKIIENDHEIINHSYSHPDGYFVRNKYFNKLSKSEIKEEIEKMHNVCKEILEYEPLGFRTPHFGELNSKKVYEVLEELGYMYSSSTNLTSTQSYGLPYYPSMKDFRKRGYPHFNIVELPLFSCPEHFFSVFDTWHCYRTKAHAKEGEFTKLFIKTIEIAKKYKIYVNLYFDPRDLNKEFEESLECIDVKVLRSCDVVTKLSINF